jgi:hypothetical protein
VSLPPDKCISGAHSPPTTIAVITPAAPNLTTKKSLLLTLVALGFALTGIRKAWPTFFLPPDERGGHVAALLSGLVVGSAFALLILAWRFQLRALLAKNRRPGVAIGIASLFCFAGLFCILTAVYRAPGEDAHTLKLLAATFVGIGAGVMALPFSTSLVQAFQKRGLFYATIAILAVALAVIIEWCGMRQFGGFDHSMVIDFGWRLLSGQRPVVDFPITAPISFFCGAWYAFFLFGTYWHSLIIAIALFSLLTFFWSLWLLKHLVVNRWHQVVLAFAVQALCVVPVSYWWYNPVTTASGAVFALAACVWLERPNSRAAAISYCCALFLMATMKANVAGLLILPTTVLLMTSRPHRIRVVGLSLLVLGVFVLWLHLQGISLIGCIRGVRGVSGRAFEAGPFFADPFGFEALVAVIIIAYVLLPLVACFAAGRELFGQWRLFALGLICAFAGFDNFVAAGETKLVDVGLVLLGVVLAARSCGAWSGDDNTRAKLRGRWLTNYLITVALILICAGLAVGITRHRVRGIGPNTFFEYRLEKEPFHGGFFQGIRTGRIFKETYAEVESVMAGIPRGQRVFFGPRMQWGYASFGVSSPVRQPVWWHPGTSFPAGDLPKFIQEFKESHYDVLIFLKNDMTYYPPELVEFIKGEFSEDQAMSHLTLYRRRQARESGPTGTSSPEKIVTGAVQFKDAGALGKVITTVVTIDVPETMPSAEFGTKVHLPLVAPTDQLILTPTQFSGSWGVYYHSADTVTINYTNTTPLAIDPPPITFRVTAFHFDE